MRQIKGIERYPNGRIKRRYSDMTENEKLNLSNNRKKWGELVKTYRFTVSLDEEKELIDFLDSCENKTQTIKGILKRHIRAAKIDK